MISALLKYLRGEEPGESGSSVLTRNSESETTWPLTKVIAAWSADKRDEWTIEDACRGTFISGANGSGKSSGPGAHLAERFLRHGFGGLVLCAKADEADAWKRLAEKTGRLQSMIFFGSDPAWKINFLNYEATRENGGGLTENIVNMFCRVTEIVSQKSGTRTNDEYWHRALKQLVRNAVDLLTLAQAKISLVEVVKIINSAPVSQAQAADKDWQRNSLCHRYLELAERAAKTSTPQENMFQLCGVFWLNEFPNLAHETRTSIVSSFTTLADALLREPFRDRFCGETTFSPTMLMDGGICVVDFDVKRYGEVGQYAQVLLKYIIQQAIERRADLGQAEARPVFIWADECQYFTISYDQLFQSTARSAKCATVYITQNLPSLYAEFGGDNAGKSRVDSLLGNLVTKIVCQQGDPVTNQWAADMIGKDRQLLMNFGDSQSSGFGTSPSRNLSNGINETIDYDCPPREFQRLRTGGARHNCWVDAIVYGGGRMWSNGKTWVKTSFKQAKQA